MRWCCAIRSLPLSHEIIRPALEQRTGKRWSGQDLKGNVAKVGAHAVAISELVGMQFFDTTMLLDQIAALVKVRSK